MRAALIQEYNDLRQQLEANGDLGMNESLRKQTGELSMIDNHPADLGSELFDRGKDLAITELLEHHYDQVNDALQRMADGLYGLCARCQQSIPFERLVAIPSTTYCVTHSQEQHISTHRPQEEEMIQPLLDKQLLDQEEWLLFTFDDDEEGFVDPIESFLATDIYGNHATFIRNKAYHKYMQNKEGDRELEANLDS